MLSPKYIEDVARRLGAQADWACSASLTLPPVSDALENFRLTGLVQTEMGLASSGARGSAKK